MAKEIATIKEEMKAEFSKLNEEIKAELERRMRSELREHKVEQQSLTKSIELAYKTIEDLTKKLDAETTKNAGLASENAPPRAKQAAL